jgi:hypothetical protein
MFIQPTIDEWYNITMAIILLGLSMTSMSSMLSELRPLHSPPDFSPVQWLIAKNGKVYLVELENVFIDRL